MSAIVLTSIMATSILAMTLFATGHTTATRASTQAFAAAEAGAQAVATSLLSGATCADAYASAVGVTPQYSVTVRHQKKGSVAWSAGCPDSNSDSLKITSTGYAQSNGAAGNSSGNQRSVEMLLTRPVPVPAFNKAIFGELSMGFSTDLHVTPTGADSPDLFTNGDFTCSSGMTVAGSIFVSGNALWSSSPCTADGDVIVEGNMKCPAGTTIGGNLYVTGTMTFTGSASSPCKILGNVWIGGNTSTSTGGGTVIGGSLTIHGGLSLTGDFPVAGAVKVRGAITSAYWRGVFLASHASNPVTENDLSVGMPPTIPSTPDNVFPQLTPTSPQWLGFATGDWTTMRKLGLTSTYDTNVCAPYSGSLTKPITIATKTAFDTRTICAGGVDSGTVKFVLNADAVIFVNTFKEAGDVQIVSGDGLPHSLYIVQPWPAGLVGCPASAGGITFGYGNWTQDTSTSVFLYTPSTVEMTTSPALRGQIYGCKIDANTAFTLNFAIAGSAVPSVTLSALTLQYTRDLTS
jgi:hypothetical protein